MSTTQPLKPFANESDAVSIDEMMLENRLDRIAMYGSLELTRDRQGLAWALKLKELLVDIVCVLEADKNLPEKIATKPAESVKNPFG